MYAQIIDLRLLGDLVICWLNFRRKKYKIKYAKSDFNPKVFNPL